eukprot:6563253-Prorocentrum_lima.AAC.1
MSHSCDAHTSCWRTSTVQAEMAYIGTCIEELPLGQRPLVPGSYYGGNPERVEVSHLPEFDDGL